jgi:flagellar hook-basal body protein
MSFQQGLSGLNTSSKALDVIGNNIANSSTVGFKSAETHFADVYANSLSGSGASQVGIGSSISGIQQAFSQGNVTATNNPLDISINGNGFFRMSNSGAITYTRNGQFHLDNAGYIINDQGMRLTGYQANAQGVILPSSPVDIQLSASQIAPRATSDPLAGNVTAALNLDSRQGAPSGLDVTAVVTAAAQATGVAASASAADIPTLVAAVTAVRDSYGAGTPERAAADRRVERRFDGAAGQHDHPAAQLSGQRADDQDAGPDHADAGQPALSADPVKPRRSHGSPDLHRDDRRQPGLHAPGGRGEQSGERLDHRLPRHGAPFRAVPVQGPGAPTRAFVVDASVANVFDQGPMMATGRPLDVAVQGAGWIAVEGPNGTEAYTRAGNLQVNVNGQLQTASGLNVLGDGGPIAIPPDNSITISPDGTVSAVPLFGDAEQRQCGRSDQARQSAGEPAGARRRRPVPHAGRCAGRRG